MQLHPYSPDKLVEDVINAIADRAFIGEDAPPRTEKEFVVQRQRARARLPAVTEAIARLVQTIGNECQSLLGKLAGGGAAGGKPKAEPNARLGAQLRTQLEALVYPGFLSATPWDRLQHLPRYLKAMTLRLSIRAARNATRATAPRLRAYGTSMSSAGKSIARRGSAILIFASSAGRSRNCVFPVCPGAENPLPVSVKRLQKLWEEVSARLAPRLAPHSVSLLQGFDVFKHFRQSRSTR